MQVQLQAVRPGLLRQVDGVRLVATQEVEVLLARRAGVAVAPRDEAYGTVAVFLDLYGNRWDLVGPPPGGR